MNTNERNTFRSAVHQDHPPEAWTPALQALWWFVARDDWKRAHDLAQDVESADGSWVHALLHRAEGDHGNAAYWYRRAGHEPGSGDLLDEAEAIAAELLSVRG